MNEYEKILLEIINFYGISGQVKKFNEESYELREAILLDVGDEESKNHIEDEMADNIIMLYQFILKLDLNLDNIERRIEYKIRRQKMRMENQ